MSDVLKPCPFCGSKVRVQEWNDGYSRDSYHMFYVICDACGASSGKTTANYVTPEVRNKCIERVEKWWNMRVTL